MVRYDVSIISTIAVLAQLGVQTASIIAVEPLARLYRVRLEPELRVEQQAGLLLLKQASSTR